MATERCRRCGYGIPTDARTCPGCARARARAVGSSSGPRPRRSSVLAVARWTRRLFVLTGWAALAAGVAAVARFVAGRERFADDVSATTVERIGDGAHGLVLTSVGLAVLALAALWTWAARARRNLGALGLDRRWGTPWALSGWVTPGAEARRGRLAVDGLWRDRSPALAALPGKGWTRRPISVVVLHWWTPWILVPALAALVVAAAGGPRDLDGVGAFVALAGAAFAVAALRSLYDVVGVVTFAQANQAERVLRERDPLTAERTVAGPAADDVTGWITVDTGAGAPAG